MSDTSNSFLFIGGPADGKYLPVSDNVVSWNVVGDTPMLSPVYDKSITTESLKCTLYKRESLHFEKVIYDVFVAVNNEKNIIESKC